MFYYKYAAKAVFAFSSKLALVVFLPFTFWTDLANKQPPFVEMTEGSMLTDHNYSINWNSPFSIYQHRSAR